MFWGVGCSGPQPNGHLLEEMRHGGYQERQAGEGRGELCAELRGSVPGCELDGY